MSRAIRIDISGPATLGVIHRFQNFGEDVRRILKDSCLIDIKEIDRATSNFVIRGIRGRESGTLSQVIRPELTKHNFIHCVKLARL